MSYYSRKIIIKGKNKCWETLKGTRINAERQGYAQCRRCSYTLPITEYMIHVLSLTDVLIKLTSYRDSFLQERLLPWADRAGGARHGVVASSSRHPSPGDHQRHRCQRHRSKEVGESLGALQCVQINVETLSAFLPEARHWLIGQGSPALSPLVDNTIGGHLEEDVFDWWSMGGGAGLVCLCNVNGL